MQSRNVDPVILDITARLMRVLSDLEAQAETDRKLINKLYAKSELSDEEEMKLDNLEYKIDILEGHADAIDRALLALSDY